MSGGAGERLRRVSKFNIEIENGRQHDIRSARPEAPRRRGAHRNHERISAALRPHPHIVAAELGLSSLRRESQERRMPAGANKRLQRGG